MDDLEMQQGKLSYDEFSKPGMTEVTHTADVGGKIQTWEVNTEALAYIRSSYHSQVDPAVIMALLKDNRVVCLSMVGPLLDMQCPYKAAMKDGIRLKIEENGRMLII